MPVRVLVVDDSTLIRRLVTRMLGAEKDIEIIGEAADGLEAIAQIKKLKPQVVTMDVEMPKLDGLGALRRITKECPVPVIMLSAHTTEGARSTMTALALGAVEFVSKPMKAGQLTPMITDLAAKIRGVAGVSMGKVIRHFVPSTINRTKPIFKQPIVQQSTMQQPTLSPKPVNTAWIAPPPTATSSTTVPKVAIHKPAIIIIGCSTGGPVALQSIIPVLPANLPVGVVVIQHIPVGFSKSLAEHLNRRSAIEVIHGNNGDMVRPGQVLICPAGCETHFQKTGSTVTLKMAMCGEPITPGTFRPSVNQVMTAATKVYGGKILGVLLTGMGRDGADAMKTVRDLGGHTIAQDESTCVVFGMPKAAIDIGGAEKVVSLPKITAEIIKLL